MDANIECFAFLVGALCCTKIKAVLSNAAVCAGWDCRALCLLISSQSFCASLTRCMKNGKYPAPVCLSVLSMLCCCVRKSAPRDAGTEPGKSFVRDAPTWPSSSPLTEGCKDTWDSQASSELKEKRYPLLFLSSASATKLQCVLSAVC